MHITKSSEGAGKGQRRKLMKMMMSWLQIDRVAMGLCNNYIHNHLSSSSTCHHYTGTCTVPHPCPQLLHLICCCISCHRLLLLLPRGETTQKVRLIDEGAGLDPNDVVARCGMGCDETWWGGWMVVGVTVKWGAYGSIVCVTPADRPNDRRNPLHFNTSQVFDHSLSSFIPSSDGPQHGGGGAPRPRWLSQ